MDGATAIASSHADLWDGISQPVSLNENGSPDYEMRVFTGTLSNGTRVTGTGDQPLGSFGSGLGSIRAGESSKAGGSWMTDFNVPHDTPHKVFALSEPLTVTSGASNTFADWISGFAGLGTLGAFDQDADGDGIDNGVEAFFGTAPNEPSVGLSEVASSDGTLTFTHPEANPPLSDVTGSYEWSLDLSAWNASGDEVSGTTVTIGAAQDTPTAGTTTVTTSITGTSPDKVFVRAVATQP